MTIWQDKFGLVSPTTQQMEEALSAQAIRDFRHINDGVICHIELTTDHVSMPDKKSMVEYSGALLIYRGIVSFSGSKQITELYRHKVGRGKSKAAVLSALCVQYFSREPWKR